MATTAYFLPPEWHIQHFILLAWPDETTDWKPYLEEIRATMRAIVEAISRYEEVVVVGREPSEIIDYLGMSLSSEQMERVRTVACPINDTWARDFGAITLLPTDDGEPIFLDFQFNGWDKKFPATFDNNITKTLYEKGVLRGQLSDNNDFVLEGGSIESDGQGTIFTTSRCLLAANRNQPLTQMDIERQLIRRLCSKRVVWLHHGQILGDDTDGHIDTIVRVCPNDTLLYVKAAEDDPQYPDFCALETELKALRTLAGEPYTLLPLPMPKAIYYDGERLPATYANFLVINNAVLVPTYQQAELDQEACKIIQTAFPDRQIIPIDATVLIRQHGSIHCLTMQFPKSTNIKEKR